MGVIAPSDCMNQSTHTARLPLRIWAVYVAAVGLLLVGFAITARCTRVKKPWEGFQAPDDVRVARELLAAKFTGPAYFQINAQQTGIPYPCISTETARRQAEGIVNARNLSPEAAARLEKLIDELTAQAPSRVVGVEHVNALQLNLALDHLR